MLCPKGHEVKQADRKISVWETFDILDGDIIDWNSNETGDTISTGNLVVHCDTCHRDYGVVNIEGDKLVLVKRQRGGK